MTDDKLATANKLARQIADIQGFIKFTELPLAGLFVDCRSDDHRMQVDTELVKTMVEYYKEKLNKLQKEFDEL